MWTPNTPLIGCVSSTKLPSLQKLERNKHSTPMKKARRKKHNIQDSICFI